MDGQMDRGEGRLRLVVVSVELKRQGGTLYQETGTR